MPTSPANRCQTRAPHVDQQCNLPPHSAGTACQASGVEPDGTIWFMTWIQPDADQAMRADGLGPAPTT